MLNPVARSSKPRRVSSAVGDGNDDIIPWAQRSREASHSLIRTSRGRIATNSSRQSASEKERPKILSLHHCSREEEKEELAGSRTPQLSTQRVHRSVEQLPPTKSEKEGPGGAGKARIKRREVQGNKTSQLRRAFSSEKLNAEAKRAYFRKKSGGDVRTGQAIAQAAASAPALSPLAPPPPHPAGPPGGGGGGGGGGRRAAAAAAAAPCVALALGWLGWRDLAHAGGACRALARAAAADALWAPLYAQHFGAAAAAAVAEGRGGPGGAAAAGGGGGGGGSDAERRLSASGRYRSLKQHLIKSGMHQERPKTPSFKAMFCAARRGRFPPGGRRPSSPAEGVLRKNSSVVVLSPSSQNADRDGGRDHHLRRKQLPVPLTRQGTFPLQPSPRPSPAAAAAAAAGGAGPASPPRRRPPSPPSSPEDLCAFRHHIPGGGGGPRRPSTPAAAAAAAAAALPLPAGRPGLLGARHALALDTWQGWHGGGGGGGGGDGDGEGGRRLLQARSAPGSRRPSAARHRPRPAGGGAPSGGGGRGRPRSAFGPGGGGAASGSGAAAAAVATSQPGFRPGTVPLLRPEYPRLDRRRRAEAARLCGRGRELGGRGAAAHREIQQTLAAPPGEAGMTTTLPGGAARRSRAGGGSPGRGEERRRAALSAPPHSQYNSRPPPSAEDQANVSLTSMMMEEPLGHLKRQASAKNPAARMYLHNPRLPGALLLPKSNRLGKTGVRAPTVFHSSAGFQDTTDFSPWTLSASNFVRQQENNTSPNQNQMWSADAKAGNNQRGDDTRSRILMKLELECERMTALDLK